MIQKQRLARKYDKPTRQGKQDLDVETREDIGAKLEYRNKHVQKHK